MQRAPQNVDLHCVPTQRPFLCPCNTNHLLAFIMAVSKLSISQLATFILYSSVAAVKAQEPESSVTASIAPAATVVSTNTSAGIPLFDVEAVQLTPLVITDLVNDDQVSEYAYLFAFDNSTTIGASTRARHIRQATKCKTYPGDLLWPSKIVWSIFDLVLGGALEPIIPLASPCYKESIYSNYNATKCAAITAAWGIEETQYVHLHLLRRKKQLLIFEKL